MAVAMFAGRPLRDTEHMGGLGDVLMSISVPAADPQLAASSAPHGSAARVRARWRSVAGADGGDERERAATGPARSRSAAVAVVDDRPARGAEAVGPSKPITVAAAKPRCRCPGRPPLRPRRSATCGRRTMSISAFTRSRAPTIENGRKPLNAAFKKFLLRCGDHWPDDRRLHRRAVHSCARVDVLETGTLVIESNPQGVKVSVNGKPQGVTPLTLKVESRHPRGRAARSRQAEDFQGARHARRSRRAVRRVPPPPIITQSHIIEGSRWLSSDPSVLFAPIRPPRTASPPFPTMSSIRKKRARLPAAIRSVFSTSRGPKSICPPAPTRTPTSSTALRPTGIAR